jgi:hypothetical protein
VALLREEKAYEKYAWTLLFVLGMFYAVIVGPIHIILGYIGAGGGPLPASTPAAAINEANSLAQSLGLFILFDGILVAGIAWTGFRGHQRWAWYFMLWFLALLIADLVLAGGIDPPAFVGIALSVLGLFLPYRKFFPKKQAIIPRGST